MGDAKFGAKTIFPATRDARGARQRRQLPSIVDALLLSNPTLRMDRNYLHTLATTPPHFPARALPHVLPRL